MIYLTVAEYAAKKRVTARTIRAEIKKDLKKKLRKEESERVKKWKKEHPIKKVNK